MTTTKKTLKQTHGRLDSQPQTLDQLWGNTGVHEYGTLDETEYKTQLDEMNKFDLQQHAVGRGIVPMDNRESLVNTLTREFKRHVARYTAPKVRTPPAGKAPTKDILSILSEGR